jgi:nitrite reductase/ring-hydroxylating ferredoxin subunit
LTVPASRREFLCRSSCALLTLGAVGVTAAELAALPLREITGRANRSERRYPIPAGDSINIDHVTQVIVVRSAGHAFVFNLACPHENAAVKWVANDHRFQCTKHDSRYQPDGEHISGRATRNMDRFAIRRDGAELVVDLDRLIRSDQDPAGWAAATVALS